MTKLEEFQKFIEATGPTITTADDVQSLAEKHRRFWAEHPDLAREMRGEFTKHEIDLNEAIRNGLNGPDEEC